MARPHLGQSAWSRSSQSWDRLPRLSGNILPPNSSGHLPPVLGMRIHDHLGQGGGGAGSVWQACASMTT